MNRKIASWGKIPSPITNVASPSGERSPCHSRRQLAGRPNTAKTGTIPNSCNPNTSHGVRSWSANSARKKAKPNPAELATSAVSPGVNLKEPPTETLPAK